MIKEGNIKMLRLSHILTNLRHANEPNSLISICFANQY